MNLLMLYGNPAAHYDDYRLFTELGFKVASPFRNYGQPLSFDRPQIEPLDEFKFLDDIVAASTELDPFGCPQSLPPEFFEPFDVIIVLLAVRWVMNYWEAMANGHRKIIWRSGESLAIKEDKMRPYRSKGLLVARSSPAELTLVHNVGYDTIIRWQVDPDEWCGWRGDINKVLTISRNIQRSKIRSWDEIKILCKDTPWVIHGPGNEGAPFNKGELSYEELREAYRSYRVFFDANAKAAPWTGTFREAWMTGAPVIAVGPKRGSWAGTHTYEIPQLIEHGLNGFCSDDLGELSEYIQLLRSDHDYARAIGEQGRKKAIEIFGWEMIREQWRKFFEDHL